MKIVILGLWHLGSVTAACCSRHFQVTGLDFDKDLIEKLSRGGAPIFEPGLDELLTEGLVEQRLNFTTDVAEAVAGADILWVCYDTPVDDNDQADAAFVLERIRRVIPHLKTGTTVLLSSQLPVGSCAGIEREFPECPFAVSPENLRLGRALEAFTKPDRVIAGLRDERLKEGIKKLFAPFCENILFMSPESAEMVKHGLNAFLATSVVFVNELARLCEHFGADAAQVSEGLKSDVRIGPRSYLRPGGAFAGGTLARDVVTLLRLAQERGEIIPLMSGIMQSNVSHQGWAFRRLQKLLGDLAGRNICILGLTYTPHTNTLRRSSALVLCRQLQQHGARISVYDPAIKEPVVELNHLNPASSVRDALQGADALVVCTEWPEFLSAPWRELLPLMRQPLILDANRFLEKQLQTLSAINYVSVGRPQLQYL
ncbi:UDP-glucose 6-dehydrogenase [soil metagenome]